MNYRDNFMGYHKYNTNNNIKNKAPEFMTSIAFPFQPTLPVLLTFTNDKFLLPHRNLSPKHQQVQPSESLLHSPHFDDFS